MIATYDQFCREVDQRGALLFSGTSGCPVHLGALTEPDLWHTDEVSDPWQWKDRIAAEGRAAYGRFFAKGALGFISLQTLPYVLSLRAGARQLRDAYWMGQVDETCMRCYEALEGEPLATHELRARLGLPGKKRHVLDRALTQLQARMLITGAGTRRRMDTMGLPTGWPGTLMSTFEQWAPAALERAEALDPARVGADLLDALCARNPTVPRETWAALIGTDF